MKFILASAPLWGNYNPVDFFSIMVKTYWTTSTIGGSILSNYQYAFSGGSALQTPMLQMIDEVPEDIAELLSINRL